LKVPLLGAGVIRQQQGQIGLAFGLAGLQ